MAIADNPHADPGLYFSGYFGIRFKEWVGLVALFSGGRYGYATVVYQSSLPVSPPTWLSL